MAKKPNLSNSKPTGPSDEPNISGSGMGAPPVSHGNKIEPVLPEDEQDVGEEMIERRMDDADDDLRHESDRKANREDR
jgi:hypothetical protein